VTSDFLLFFYPLTKVNRQNDRTNSNIEKSPRSLMVVEIGMMNKFLKLFRFQKSLKWQK